MRQSELLKGIASLDKVQHKLLIRQLEDYLRLNTLDKNKQPEICPCCGKKSHMIKKGFNKGKQRFRCKDCNKIFTYDSKTITSYMKISRGTFLEILLDTLSCEAIAVTAARLNLSQKSVFDNRHKILVALEHILDEETIKLSGTIEVDETYILDSQKGSSNLNRKARHRGEPSNYRGLSHEQVCIVTTTDRNGHEIFKAVGHAKPTSNSIKQMFHEKIVKKSILYTDGAFCYDQIADENSCSLVQLYQKENYNTVEHLNTVNYIHSFIKAIITKFRGVATKYINRYLSLFVFLRRFQGMDDNEMMPIAFKSITNLHYRVSKQSLNNHNLFDE